MTPSLSVVIPVYNERPADLSKTLAALGEALARSPFTQPEVVIVDDGSDPPISTPKLPGAPVRILRQENRGRFEARRAGLEGATGEYALLLDGRVTLEPDSLRWVAERVDAGDAVWNGHCEMANLESPFARFWNVLTHVAFADYLNDPRTTSYTLADYDRYPKGTTHFLAPRSWLLDAIASFSSRYEDSRFSSDDTHLLRAIAARDRIHISPGFASAYRNREALGAFLHHAIRRGTTFYDGFARPGTRFRPFVRASFPASVLGLTLLLRRPRAAVGTGLALSGLAAGFARRHGRPAAEVASFGLLTVPFASAYSMGIWRGAWLARTGSRRRAAKDSRS